VRVVINHRYIVFHIILFVVFHFYKTYKKLNRSVLNKTNTNQYC